MAVEKTKDSFGNNLWKVDYLRCGKIHHKTFYDEEQAIAFDKTSSRLENEPIDKPKKQRRRKLTIPKW